MEIPQKNISTDGQTERRTDGHPDRRTNRRRARQP